MSGRRKIVSRLLRSLALSAVVGATLVVGTNVWVKCAANDRTRADIAALPSNAIAIVPGAPTSRGEVKAALLGRLQGALALYRGGHARAILVSGLDSARDPETTAMRAWLEGQGVDPRDILADRQGTRTRQTMLRASRLYAVDKAIVCTEALHMPRALFLAQQNGIDATGYELASPLSRHPRFVAVEAIKTTLAVVEETLARVGPTADATVSAAR